MGGKNHKTINDYEKHIFMCEKRRKEQKLKGKPTSKLTDRLSRLRKVLKRRKEIETTIKDINNKIKNYFGFSLWKSNKNQTKQYKLARRFFYRLGLESKVTSPFLHEYTGANNIHAASTARMCLIRNKEQNELYKRFLIYEP